MAGVPLGPQFGPRAGYDFDAETWSLGGQLRLGGGRGLELIPSGDFYFDTDAWQLNLDAAFPLGRLRAFYGGLGAGFFHQTVTETHLNLFLGLRLGGRVSTPVRPYAEARWMRVDGNDPFRLVFGMNFALR